MYCETAGSVESGGGKDFGPWVAISHDAHPGYQLVTAAFWLNGGHPCHGTESSPKINGKATGAGSWAECYEDSRDSKKVVAKAVLITYWKKQ